MEIVSVRMKVPEEANIILGQAHFIKTAEDVYEAIVNTAPASRFAVAFNEASGPSLVRVEGNDEEMKKAAAENALAIGAGHVFVVMLRNAYPINVLERIARCPEVCGIYGATANPLEVLVAQTEQGRGVIGIVDGRSPMGVEGAEEAGERKRLLRKIGYKL